MTNIKLYIKTALVILFIGGIMVISVGCSNKETESNKDLPSETPNNQNNITEENSSVNENDKSENENKIEAEEKEETVSKKDTEVITYFKSLKNNVEDTLNSTNVETAKDKLKGTFITVVDFIFYEGEIKGIKFDDLTEGAKQNILETAATIDSAIMTKFPNYKEEISSNVSIAYNKASELIKKGATNIKDFSKEKLGEDNYNAIIAAKDELVDYTKQAAGFIGDVVGSLWDKGTGSIKNWYENFKNN